MREEDGLIHIEEGEIVVFYGSDGNARDPVSGPTNWSKDASSPSRGGWSWEITKLYTPPPPPDLIDFLLECQKGTG